jgi:hypothetical protein
MQEVVGSIPIGSTCYKKTSIPFGLRIPSGEDAFLRNADPRAGVAVTLLP